MDCGGALAIPGTPGDGFAERPVDFEGAGAVAVVFEAAEVAGGKLVVAEFGELARRDVAEDDLVAVQLFEGADGVAGYDAPAEAFEMGGEGV